MVFSSTVFLFVFMPVVLLAYYSPFAHSRKARNIVLLISSLVFYVWGEPVFVFLMIFSIVMTWICGLFLRAHYGKILLAIASLFHIAILFIFKYLVFAAQEIGMLLSKDFSMEQISLPIGISFFTFQLMSYLFDVYRKKVEPQKDIINVALYVALFPALIAGPIIRYEEIENQIQFRHERWDSVANGMRRFIIGLGKKVLLANYMAQIADNTFDFLPNMSVALAWYGAVAYTLQIYFDFSGYSDIAIGIGEMFGFRFPENFNYPYTAHSVTDFWRKWHISLSRWFRDYVYIPLGGNRVNRKRWLFNMLMVWMLTGIWHGANWTYILWGFLYFVFLVVEKLTGIDKKIGGLSHFYTMLIVILLWVVFRSASISAAALYIGHMFGFNANGFVDHAFIEYWRNTKWVFLAAFIGCTPVLKIVGEKLRQRNLDWVNCCITFVVFCVSIVEVISSTYNPFIYFNF